MGVHHDRQPVLDRHDDAVVTQLVAERTVARQIHHHHVRALADVQRSDLPIELQARTCAIEIAGQAILLMQPQTFMNRSGESVEIALERWPELVPETDLLVVYDDMDLPTGRIRLRPSGGGGGHRGIGDILERLDTKAVPRLRFGIGHPGDAAGVLDWVLQPFAQEEERDDLPESLEWAADAVEAVAAEGVTPAMGRFNAKRPDSRSRPEI